MFGAYRLLLATLVAYSHIGEFHHLCGSYAVFAFFILSGYLMTLVLEQVYLRKRAGLRDYMLNRFLRIYPLYWLAIALAAVVARSGPMSLWGEIMVPRTLQEVIYNIIILGPMPHGPNESWLLSVTWSLRTELLFYLLLPLLLRLRPLYYLWLAVSAALLLLYVYGTVSFSQRYFTFWGAWPAFAAGSAVYHFRGRLPELQHARGLGLLALALALMCFYKTLLPEPMNAGFYLPMVFNVAVVHYLSRVDAGRWRRLDAWLGELAYPVFLLHLPVAELARRVLPAHMPSYSAPFFVCAMVLVYMAAMLVWRFAEQPLQRRRRVIRNR